MKVHINEENCIGCGQCEATCSEVFKIGNDGIAHVTADEIKEDVKEDVEIAASGCPTDAIEIKNA